MPVILGTSAHQERVEGGFAMIRIVTIFALIASSVALSACNTVKGLGRDIESVGNAGEKVIN
jgi:entericidin A